MKKFTFGILVGILISAMVAVPLLLNQRREKFEFGQHIGMASGLSEAVDALEREFGLYDGRSPYNVLFSVKTVQVVSTETNGVRTVRVRGQ